MSTTDSNLIRPGECEIPFPVPPLVRTYRIYIPLADLAAPKGDTPIGPPQTTGTNLRFNGSRAARADRAVDVFGGIPLNALDTADNPAWTEPMLAAIEVRDPAAVIRSMSVQEGGKPIALSIAPDHVTELLDTGSTLAVRSDGGFVRLKLSADAKKPLVHVVPDLQAFLSNPSAPLPDGRRRAIRLSQTELTKLVEGKPVVSGSGANATVLMRIINGGLAADAGDESTRSTTGTTTPPPPPPGGTTGNVPPPPGTTSSPPPTPAPPALALLLPLDQTWLLKTYERGRLASSISLIPQEEVTIDIYSWDRRKTSREETTSFDSEVNAESQSLDRDTRDVFGELSKTGNFGWGLNGSYSGYGVSVGGNVNNGTTLNNITRNTLQNFHEQTTKASAKVHSSRQLKITESTEQGSETRVTRKLRNSNLCHPVTFHYFELVARYGVTTGYVKNETVFVLLVDNPLARPLYDIDYVRTYESVIRGALLDPAVASGLEAARVLWMLSHSAPVICNDCPCPEDLIGSENTNDFVQAVNAVKALGTAVSTSLRDAVTFSWTTFFFTLIPPSVPPTAHGALPVNVDLALRRTMFVDYIEQAAPGLLAGIAATCAPLLASTSATAAQLVAFANQFGALDPAGIDSALTPDADLQTRIKGLIEARVRTAYAGMAKSTVIAMMNGNRTGNAFIDSLVDTWNQLTLNENNAAGAIANAIIGSLGLSPGFGSSDGNGVKQLFKSTTTALATWTSDNTKSETAAAEAKRSHQAAFTSVFPAANVLAAQERFDALVRHLRANADYYANVMVTDMVSRGQFPVPTELLPFIGFVALQPMTVVRGRLAYPIDLSSAAQFAAARALLQGVIDAIPNDTATGEITLPTPGFVVEPKLSCCSACEDFVEESRKIELDLKTAQADKEKWEATRRAKRVNQATPDLDPFDPIQPSLKISVDQVPPTA